MASHLLDVIELRVLGVGARRYIVVPDQNIKLVPVGGRPVVTDTVSSCQHISLVDCKVVLWTRFVSEQKIRTEQGSSRRGLSSERETSLATCYRWLANWVTGGHDWTEMVEERVDEEKVDPPTTDRNSFMMVVSHDI